MALEFEIERWKDFRKTLQRQEQRDAFDKLMDMCRNNAMAGGAACNPIVFEPMIMSILLGQQLKIMQLEQKINDLVWQQICDQPPTENNSNLKPHTNEV
jgi:hypothetical protein